MNRAGLDRAEQGQDRVGHQDRDGQDKGGQGRTGLDIRIGTGRTRAGRAGAGGKRRAWSHKKVLVVREGLGRSRVGGGGLHKAPTMENEAVATADAPRPDALDDDAMGRSAVADLPVDVPPTSTYMVCGG
jgi:hypothetical protein